MRRFLLSLLLPALLGAAAAAATAATETPAPPPPPPLLAKMVDLGADKCPNCKKMAPLLVELRADYAGLVDVVFIDVWKDEDAARPYHLRVIPTQVFIDRDGMEVFRHEGLFSREDIEMIFQEKFGVAPMAKKEAGES